MVYDKAHELAKALKFSPEYRQYKEAKERINSNPDSLKIVADFRVKQLEIQAMQLMGQEIPPEKMQVYEKMSEVLHFHPAVREYLQAEYKIIQIFSDVQKILAEALDLELPKVKKDCQGPVCGL